MKRKLTATALLVAASLALGAGAASAATCSIGSVSYELTQGTPDGVLASGCFNGNDKNDVPGNTYLGRNDWVLAGATDGGGDGKASITLLEDPETWSVTGTVFEHMMVALKQASSFALFKLDTSKGLAGLWGTLGPGRGAVDDYSHASIWYAGKPVEQPPPVPLPAAGWLMLAGLGALAALRRKGRAA